MSVCKTVCLLLVCLFSKTIVIWYLCTPEPNGKTNTIFKKLITNLFVVGRAGPPGIPGKPGQQGFPVSTIIAWLMVAL